MLKNINRFLLIINTLPQITNLIMKCRQPRIASRRIQIILPVDSDNPFEGLQHAGNGQLELFVLLVDGGDVHVVYDGLGVRFAEGEVAEEERFVEVEQGFLAVAFGEMEQADV